MQKGPRDPLYGLKALATYAHPRVRSVYSLPNGEMLNLSLENLPSKNEHYGHK